MSRPLTILLEDEHLVFVDKPARVMSVAAPGGRAEEKGPSVVERLAEQGLKVIPVHRLDYETSGVMVLAKTEEAARALRDSFERQEVEKVYLALVQGWPSPKAGSINLRIRDLGATAEVHHQGAAARTDYEVIRHCGPCALVEAKPITGRHNQIRLHFAHVGRPLVGERKFARGRDALLNHKRALLHASVLALPHPISGEPLRVAATLPRALQDAMTEASKLSPALRDQVGVRDAGSGGRRPRRGPPSRGGGGGRGRRGRGPSR